MKFLMWMVGTLLLTQNAAVTVTPASVDGIVVSFGTNDPVGKAEVELRKISPGPTLPANLPANFSSAQIETLLRGLSISGGADVAANPAIFTTSSDGKFTFRNVTPGEYRVYVTRSSGYIPGEYGQRTPVGTGIPLTLASGQNISNMKLALTPASSISGRILDGDGDPVAYARVLALRVAYQEGERILVNATKSTLTDDHGEYRIYSLPPGQYYMASRPYENRSSISYGVATPSRFGTPQGADAPLVTLVATETGAVIEQTWRPIFYPSSPDALTAQVISLGIGESRRGIDINLAGSAAPARHVRGNVINGTTGQPAAGITVRLLPRYQLTPTVVMPSATTDSTGHFDVGGVLAGSYSLTLTGSPDFQQGAIGPAATRSGLSGYMVLDVGNSNVDGLSLVASKGVDIAWNAVMQGGTSDPAVFGRLRISLFRKPIIAGAPTGALVTTAGWPGLPPPSETPVTVPVTTGGFILRDVPFGEYSIKITSLPQGTYVKSISMGQSDVLMEGIRVSGAITNRLEIVLAMDTGAVTGRVLDAKQEATPNVTAVLVPDPARRYRLDLFQNVSTDANGRFRFQGVVPGEYKLFAWEDVDSGAWQDPEFLRSRENFGTPIQINPGSNQTMDVKVIPWTNTP
jgi:protocatechuate 3,4-dioxygenase beta subunit